MICYDPLLRTMAKLNIDWDFIEDKLECYGLRRNMEAHRYISTATLDKICALLRCEVQDVILFKDGKQEVVPAPPKKDYVMFDWKKIKLIVKQHNSSFPKLSRRIKKERSYLNTMARTPKIGTPSAKIILNGINKEYGLELKLNDLCLKECPF